MQLSLPDFEATPVDSAVISLRGDTSQPVPALRMGEEVVMVVQGTVDGVLHDAKKGILIRGHKILIESGFVVVDPMLGVEWLQKAQELLDEARGRPQLSPVEDYDDAEEG